jgi:hypothetical protein
MRICPDPDPGQALKPHQVEFLRKKILLIHTYKRHLKVRKPGLFVKFLSISMLLDRIRIRFPNTDPDPGKPNQCKSMRIPIQESQINVGSVSRIAKSMRIRIHNIPNLLYI